MLTPLEIGLCVADLDRMVTFYNEVLGLALIEILEVASDRARAAALTTGAYRVARLQTPTGERLKLLQPSIPPRAPQPYLQTLDVRSNSYLTFIVDDLEDVLKRLRRDGSVAMLTGSRPVEIRPGTSVLFVKDPEGNVLEFCQMRDVAAYRPDLYPPADSLA